MRIAIISSRYPPNVIGGAGKVVHTLAEGLVDKGHQVSVLTLAFDGSPCSDQINDVDVQRIRLRNLYLPGKSNRSPVAKMVWHLVDSYNLLAAQDVKEWLLRVKPDIVNTHVISGFSVSIWKSVKDLGIPLIHTLHDQYILCPRTTMFRDGQNCQKRCLSCRIFSIPRLRATRHIDKIIGVSQYILDHHVKNGVFSRTKKIVINNGIKPLRLTFRKKINEDVKKRGIRIGYLGKINPSKGINKLIDAFLMLDPGLAELWIAGRGFPTYEGKLRERTKMRSDVRWLGFVKPAELLGNIDVLVVPSLWNDTAPLVIFESFSFGVPVIGSERGGIPELVNPDLGWLFDPSQPESLSKLLQGVIKNKSKLSGIGNNGMRYAQKYTIERMIFAYEKEYENIIGKG